MTPMWRTAWVTGASTGIGFELARQLAARGTHVAASARSADKLAALAATSPLITAYPLDVTDLSASRATAAAIERELGPIDLALFNAGTWAPMTADRLSAVEIARGMDVNYVGAANGLDAVLPAMRARRAGHVALVASVAGYRGLPRSLAYGPTKAAIINLAEILKVELAPDNIDVSVVNPGFVDTPMTAVNAFPMPFIMPAGDAARRIIDGLAKRKFEIAFPWQLVLLLKAARILPYSLYFAFVRRFVWRNPTSSG